MQNKKSLKLTILADYKDMKHDGHGAEVKEKLNHIYC